MILAHMDSWTKDPLLQGLVIEKENWLRYTSSSCLVIGVTFLGLLALYLVTSRGYQRSRALIGLIVIGVFLSGGLSSLSYWTYRNQEQSMADLLRTRHHLDDYYDVTKDGVYLNLKKRTDIPSLLRQRMTIQETVTVKIVNSDKQYYQVEPVNDSKASGQLTENAPYYWVRKVGITEKTQKAITER